MRIRGAVRSDFGIIDAMYKANEFKLDTKHLERILVAEDENGIVAIGVLNSLIEASFLVEPSRSRKSRVIALTAMLQQVDLEVKTIGYDNFHVFATNKSILDILKSKFDFVRTKAMQVLIKWVE